MQTITFGKGKLVSKPDHHRVNLSLLGPKYNSKREQKKPRPKAVASIHPQWGAKRNGVLGLRI
jgi:hypothetical protein